MLVSAATAMPTQSRTSFSASLGTIKDARKIGKNLFPVHPEGDDLVLGGAKGLSAARVSSIANLHGVTSRLDWYLDRVVHFDRPDPLTVDHDIVRATTDSAPMALCVNFSVADTCRSPLISERRFFLREIIRRDEEGPASELPREIEEAFSGAALEPHIRGIWRQIADAVAEYGPEPSGEQIFGKGYESDAWDAPVWSSTETVRLLAMFRSFAARNRAEGESAQADLPRRHIAAEHHFSAPADPIAAA